MNPESKITAVHLQRSAYLYIRQSSLHHVLENTESTERQYALRRRAVALGWPDDRVVVIDRDQGQSGASASDRAGFQRLVAEVGLGKAGIVMGLEVSRLARNCADWHRVLEICALSNTLILDEDGLYDPVHYNDRLLLGLKGTMSEAELHILKARLVGGVLNTARRAELKMPLPVGLVYTEDDRVELDPDQQVQQSLRVFFSTFTRTGSAWRTVQSFRQGKACASPSAVRPAPEKSSGRSCRTTSRSIPCTIRATRVRFVLVAGARGRTSTAGHAARSCRASNGAS
ncbi:MAG: recombinase family protein [Opitutaceae bacterium]